MKILLLLVLFSLVSCVNVNDKKKRVINNHSPLHKSIFSEKKKVNEIFNPIGMAILQDYYIFQNEFGSFNDCFFVYTIKDFKFCYSFGAIGQGKDEFIAPRIFNNNKENSLSIFDSAYNKIYTYEITPEKEVIVSNENIDKCVYPVQEISYVNDNSIVFLVMSNEDVTLYSYSIEDKTIVDSMRFDTGFKDLLGKDFSPIYNNFRFSNLNNKIVISFHYINDIFITEVDINGNFTKREHEFKNNHLDSRKSIYDNILYYSFSSAEEKYIFAQYYGYKFKRLAPFPINLGERSFDFLIEVYNWEKQPIAILELDDNFFRIFMDNKNKKILTWNPLKDFNYLSEYDISFLYEK